jgi:hypothetical protein
MIPNLDAIIALFIVAMPILIFIMFLPALVELKRPKDSGPRIIMDKIPEVKGQTTHIISLQNIFNVEEELRLDHSIVQKISKIIEVLPNLEV